MNALAPVAPRLAPLLGKLGSPHDGEVLSAARAAGRILAKHGLTFNDLAAAAIEDPAQRTVYRAPDPPTWRERVEWCLCRDLMLDQRDIEFLHGLTRWQRDRLSGKQMKWLADIEAKIAARSAA